MHIDDISKTMYTLHSPLTVYAFRDAVIRIVVGGKTAICELRVCPMAENFEMQQPPVCSVSVLAISKCIKNYSRYGIIYGFQVHVYYTLQNSHQWNITLFIVIRNTKAGRIFCV